MPHSLSKMQQLGYLDVSGNMLTGALPALTSNNMINLRLAQNYLTGTIPASYGGHPPLVHCSMQSTLCRISLPYTWLPMTAQENQLYIECAL